MEAVEQDAELIRSYRAEAMALFETNQARRVAAERVGALIVAVAAVAVVVGIATGNDDVVIPLPPALLLLLSYMLQQYVEVTVTGTARGKLEALLEEKLGTAATIYEYAVSPIRQSSPLVRSVRLLQGIAALVVLTTLVLCTVIAFEDQPWWVKVAYTVTTSLSLLSAVWSYRDMLAASEITRERLEEQLSRPKRPA